MQQTGGKGVDVVLNSLSGDAIAKSLSVLSTGGRFLEIGKADIWPTARMNQQRPDVSYKVVDLVEVTKEQPQLIQSMLTRLVAHLEDNQLSPLPVKTYVASQAVDGFRFMQQAKHIGKVVITPPVSTDAPLSDSSKKIRADATYLITGGTGALGLQLAQWLAGSGRNLSHTSRS